MMIAETRMQSLVQPFTHAAADTCQKIFVFYRVLNSKRRCTGDRMAHICMAMLKGT